MFSRRTWQTAFPALLMIQGVAVADQLVTQAQKAGERWDQAYNAGDMAELGKLYSPDAMVIPKGAPVIGEAIPKFFAGLKAKGFLDHKVTVQSALPRDGMIIVSGRWEMNGPGDGGATKKFEGNWVNVMERQGDDLRTVLHTWN